MDTMPKIPIWILLFHNSKPIPKTASKSKFFEAFWAKLFTMTLTRLTSTDFLISPIGVGINMLCPDFQTVTDLTSLQALNIFAHLSGQELDDAEDFLLERVVLFNGTLTGLDFSIVHTNGVQNIAYGFDSNSGAVMAPGVLWNPTLSRYELALDPAAPYWKNVLFPNAVGIRFNLYTNIVAGDCLSNFTTSNDIISIELLQCYQDTANSATSGQRCIIHFYQTAGNGNNPPNGQTTAALASGPVYAGNIGDIGTFTGTKLINTSSPGNQMGQGSIYNTGYWVIGGVYVGINIASKTFKFRLEVEYTY